MTIRRTRADDLDAVFALHAAAFGKEGEARLALELEPLAAVSLVAEENETVVGHVVCSRATTVGATTRVLALGPIGVAPQHQRRGIGSALVRAALAEARAAGEDAVILLGHPSYYPRFGFEPVARHRLDDRFGWGDAFQIAVLTTAPPAGTRFLWPRPFLVVGTPDGAVDTLRW